jgi:ArsR family transcriptional regulator, arsenate/arsenite/antimonite-responsive transcriptional repressor
MADIFDVISDATRRELMLALLERYVSDESDTGEISVGDLVERLGLSQPTVSKHLKVLRDHGLVSVREDGQHRYYRLDSNPLEEVDDWLIPFLSADFDEESDFEGIRADVGVVRRRGRRDYRSACGRGRTPSAHGYSRGHRTSDETVAEDVQAQAIPALAGGGHQITTAPIVTD